MIATENALITMPSTIPKWGQQFPTRFLSISETYSQDLSFEAILFTHLYLRTFNALMAYIFELHVVLEIQSDTMVVCVHTMHVQPD